MTSHTPDRRAVCRYDLSLPIEVRARAEQSRLLRGTTRDVSSRGIYFVADQELSPGSELRFTLTLPGALTRGPDVYVYALGRVVRTETRTEDDAKRFGIGASIETYDLTRAELTSR